MHNKKRLNQLRKIIALDPVIEEILLSAAPVEDNSHLRGHLANLLLHSQDGDRELPSLEWITCRDAVSVLRTILNTRSEELAGFSLLAYLDNSAAPARGGRAAATGRFLAELTHLFRGDQRRPGQHLHGKAAGFPPPHRPHRGPAAFADLSRMARGARAMARRYPSGMDEELVRQHSRNAAAVRVLRHHRWSGTTGVGTPATLSATPPAARTGGPVRRGVRGHRGGGPTASRSASRLTTCRSWTRTTPAPGTGPSAPRCCRPASTWSG